MPRGGDLSEDGVEGFHAINEQAELVAGQVFLSGDGGKISNPSRMKVVAPDLAGFDFIPHAVDFAAVIHQLFPHGLRVGFKPPASEKPVERKAEDGERNQADDPGDRALRGPYGEKGVNRAQNRDGFKNQID